ncbi:MAG TPA: DNA double-strand break repair nuclease NurA [Armatimonadota bacterium]|jgi:hypothetical protein
MPSFIEQYASEIRAKSGRFAECFGSVPRNDVERRLADEIARNWMPLPQTTDPRPRATFAVDGASASRPLMNGASFLVCQSLLAGKDVEESMVAVEVVRGGDVRDANRGLDRLRQFLEFRIAADHLDRLAGGMLLIDGSLLSDLSHMLYLRPMRLGGYPDLRAALIGAYLDLVEGCRQRNILLVGVAKSSRDSMLCESLLDTTSPKDRLCDAEILHRFLGGAPGYTRPILFGSDGTSARGDDAGFEPDDAIMSRVQKMPCFAVFYVRLAQGEDALRVDVTGDGIGCTEALLSFKRAWGDADAVAPVVRRLVSQHGGASVYNAPLYAVDRMVRLSSQTVDGAYMALLRDATGHYVMADRGTRRFTRG